MENLSHYSVLLNESIDLLNIDPDGIYVDCTLGGGGHSEAILKHLKNGHLYAFDQDTDAIKKASKRLEPFKDLLTIINANFANIKSELANLGITKVNGIIYDLGVSSFQFDLPERGFSYRFDGPLDMRMNLDGPLTAKQIVNEYSFSDLKHILYAYGEEKFAPMIAKKICNERMKKPIETTFELVDIIKSALPCSVLRKPGHPAKQTFQALRIEVNNELLVLENSLKDALDILDINGVLAVISFQSLEDKCVKHLFKKMTTLDLPAGLPFLPDNVHIDYELINSKVILPSDEELTKNNRSHSAKLRAIKRINIH